MNPDYVHMNLCGKLSTLLFKDIFLQHPDYEILEISYSAHRYSKQTRHEQEFHKQYEFNPVPGLNRPQFLLKNLFQKKQYSVYCIDLQRVVVGELYELAKTIYHKFGDIYVFMITPNQIFFTCVSELLTCCGQPKIISKNIITQPKIKKLLMESLYA